MKSTRARLNCTCPRQAFVSVVFPNQVAGTVPLFTLNPFSDGYGIGDVEIEISVETQALPFTADNEEEVTITLDIITFRAVAQQ